MWFSETHTPWHGHGRDGSPSRPKNGAPGGRALPTPLLGVHKGTAIYLLYNGILGDTKSNTLTGRVLRDLPRHEGPKVIFSECTSLGDDRLRREDVIFKHIPYDIKGR